VDEQWVRRNMPHKIVFSKRLVRWYESDVDGFIEERRAKLAS
jgi:predicted DNA-binding transcriptional regulator AlpA